MIQIISTDFNIAFSFFFRNKNVVEIRTLFLFLFKYGNIQYIKYCNQNRPQLAQYKIQFSESSTKRFCSIRFSSVFEVLNFAESPQLLPFFEKNHFLILLFLSIAFPEIKFQGYLLKKFYVRQVNTHFIRMGTTVVVQSISTKSYIFTYSACGLMFINKKGFHIYLHL